MVEAPYPQVVVQRRVSRLDTIAGNEVAAEPPPGWGGEL